MAEDDNWRRRRADELFGDATSASWPTATPQRSLYRGTREQPAATPMPRMVPIAPDASRPGDVREPVRAVQPPNFGPTSRRPEPHTAREMTDPEPSRSRRRWWPVAVTSGLLLAAGLGWAVRDLSIVPPVVGSDRYPTPLRRSATTTPAPQPSAPDPLPTEEVAVPVVVEPPTAIPLPPPVASVDPPIVPVERVRPDRVPSLPRVSEPDVAVPASFSPSFNCRRARASVTKLICRDAELSGLDRRLDAAYRARIREADPDGVERLQNDESDFLNRRGECSTASCISDVYRDRIDELARRPRARTRLSDDPLSFDNSDDDSAGSRLRDG